MGFETVDLYFMQNYPSLAKPASIPSMSQQQYRAHRPNDPKLASGSDAFADLDVIKPQVPKSLNSIAQSNAPSATMSSSSPLVDQKARIPNGMTMPNTLMKPVNQMKDQKIDSAGGMLPIRSLESKKPAAFANPVLNPRTAGMKPALNANAFENLGAFDTQKQSQPQVKQLIPAHDFSSHTPAQPYFNTNPPLPQFKSKAPIQAAQQISTMAPMAAQTDFTQPNIKASNPTTTQGSTGWGNLDFFDQKPNNGIDVFDVEYLKNTDDAFDILNGSFKPLTAAKESPASIQVAKSDKPQSITVSEDLVFKAEREGTAKSFESHPKPSRKSVSKTESQIEQVCAMGFDQNIAEHALEVCQGNVQQAIEYLILANEPMPPAQSKNEKIVLTVVEQAQTIGASVFKNAKSLFEYSKRKIATTLEKSQIGINLETEPALAHSPGFVPYSDQEPNLSSRKSEIKENPPILRAAQTELKQVLKDIPTVDLLSMHDEVQYSPQVIKQPLPIPQTCTQPKSSHMQSSKEVFKSDKSVAAPAKIPAQAALILKQVQADSPVQDLIKQKGNDAYKRGQFHEAAAFYTQALIGSDDETTLLNNRAAAYLHTAEYKLCVDDCNRVQVLEPHNLKSLTRRAQAFEALEDWVSAQSDYKTLMGLSPTLPVSQGLSRCAQNLVPKQVHVKEKISSKAQERIDDKVQQKVDQLRDQNQKEEREQDLILALKDSVDAQVFGWSKGKETNIRALLSSLDLVLWPQLGWKGVNLGQLITNQQVKISYMKAVSKVHPDKLSAACETKNRMIAGHVFSILSESFDGFKAQNGM